MEGGDGCSLPGSGETLDPVFSSLVQQRCGRPVGSPVKGCKGELRAWSICHTGRVSHRWECSAWRREGWEEDCLHVCEYLECGKTMDPGSSQ